MLITHYGSTARHATRLMLLAAVGTLSVAAAAPAARAQQVGPQPVVHKVQSASERLNMIANSSRILVLEQRIPQAQVNNPEIVEVTPLSPTQLQVFAKRAGVTQINLWNEDQQVYTIEVIVDADARELTAQLERQFPHAALKVIPFPNSVMVTGYVDDPRDVTLIIAIAQQYHPQVIDNIRVGGVQQVMLKVQVMEVSRSKLRTLGIDFAELAAGSGSFVGSNTSGLLRPAGLLPTNQVITSALTGAPTGVVQVPGSLVSSGGQNFSFGIIDSQQAFVGFLEALRQDDLAKILAEPVLVTNSGRPAYFNSGGEFPILVPQSLGTVSIQYRPYGTQVDFVPIVLGNGWIRLEVRPRVSEIDPTRSVTMNNISVPALKVREIDTGVEMRPGQTLAIAGLVQTRLEAQKRGLPFFSELPYIGAFFSRTHDQYNEVELLIFVTPQLAEAMDPNQVPPCGPGMDTTTPTDFQMFVKGHVEVPRLSPAGADMPPGSVGAPVMVGEPVLAPSPETQNKPLAPQQTPTNPQSSGAPEPPNPTRDDASQSALPRLTPPRSASNEANGKLPSKPGPVRLAANPVPTQGDDASMPTIVSNETTAVTASATAPLPSAPSNQATSTIIRSVTPDRSVSNVQIKTPAPATGEAVKPQSLPGLHGSVGYDEIK